MTISVTTGEELELPAAERRRIAYGIQLELARRSMARKHLVAESGLSSSTIDKALAGHFSPGTLARIEAVLGKSFGGTAEPEAAIQHKPGGEIAPVELGAYARIAVETYVGQYLTLRPAFTERGTIISFATEISWDSEQSCLVFREGEKPDKHHEHLGRVSIPAASAYVYLVSLTLGAMRMVVVSQLGPKREMRGLITTLSNPVGSVFIPASAPIVYLKRDSLADCAFGYLKPGDRAHDHYREILRETVAKSHVTWGEP